MARVKSPLTLLLLTSSIWQLVGRSGDVVALTQHQQQQSTSISSNLSSTVLPGLSERAANGGLNSRYLSASSTASLAAATVAAAANQPPSTQNGALQQQQQILAQHAQAASNNHQQQQQPQSNQQQQQQAQQQAQQQQQQQQQPLSTNLQNSVQQASGASQFLSPPPNVQQQQQQQQLQFPTSTPVMATTYTYNPQTGQLVPSELSAGALLGAQQQYNGPNNAGLVSASPFGSPFIPQQQVPSYQAALGRPFAAAQAQRVNQQFGSQFGGQISPFGRPNHGITTFSRRQGQQQRLPTAATGHQFGANSFTGPVSNQQIDDDSNGLFQQQQVSSANSFSLADQLAATFGLDPANFGGPTSLLNQNNGGYSLVGQQAAGQLDQQQQQQSQLGLLPNPSTNFGGFASATTTSGQDYALPASSGLAVQRTDSQCAAADGRHGTCYQASECIKRGGTPMGRCGSSANGLHSNGQLNDQLTGSSHVCCLFDVTCGQFAAERFVYFRNPNYPAPFEQSRMCRAKIGKLDKGVCQFRLDLLRFDIGKPTNGNCSQDMFVVSGQNENYVIPKICGLNDGQHYYVGVDESGVITLHMMMMGYAYRRSFEILITQIPCRSDFAAPPHCLQYYMGTHGTIKSFNYDDDYGQSSASSSVAYAGYEPTPDNNVAAAQFGAGQQAPYGIQFPAAQLQGRQQQLFVHNNQQRFAGSDLNSPVQYGGYPNDLDYTICIRKESGFCSITYALSRSDQSGQLSPFAVGAGSGQSWLGGPIGGQNDSWQAAAISSECRDDYLLVGGVRLCSSQSTGGPYEQQAFGNFSGSLNGGGGGIGANQAAQLLQQQQLQQQHSYLVQQLAKLQQQQAAQANNNSAIGVGSNGNTNNGNNNLEQQQAALLQQLMLTQQQLSLLAANGQLSSRQQLPFDFLPNGQSSHFSQPSGTEQFGGSTIITDTTSGPFLLRFVSNMARNARGFHIDYRQNPCK